MKVYISPYRDSVSIFSIVSATFGRFIKDEDKLDAITIWIEKSPIGKFIKWCSQNTDPKIFVKLHDYDTWSMDYTLSHIIHPMLLQLQATKQGSPIVDDEDVPEHIRSTMAKPKEESWDTDEFFHDRWDWVLAEMIWAFDQIRDDKWEKQYHTGNVDIVWSKENEKGFSQMSYGPNHTYKADYEAIRKHSARINNGTRLFGKYYAGLWD